MTTYPNENAYPVVIEELGLTEHGLTKREYFAAIAMQALLSNENQLIAYDKKAMEFGVNLQVVTASQSLSYADALIEELNKENNK